MSRHAGSSGNTTPTGRADAAAHPSANLEHKSHDSNASTGRAGGGGEGRGSGSAGGSRHGGEHGGSEAIHKAHEGRTDPSPTPANRLGLNYRQLPPDFSKLPHRIIDFHTHLNGPDAVAIYKQVCDLYGIHLTWSQTQLAQADAVREVMGDRVRFIAIPEYMAPDKAHAHRQGFLDNIRTFRDRYDARIVKFWNAPRYRDFWDPTADADVLGLDSEWRTRAMDLATDLGMAFMVHVADPDTWFATKYADSARYGTKRDQYAEFERVLDRYPGPWIAAHMGGWPEDLEFIAELLARHDNLHLDTSATKWMVRELSRHPTESFVAFVRKWKDRLLFGSDIVTSDEHLRPSDPENTAFGATQASSPEQAFELYASRYWALRALFETTRHGPSPIADPDLAMVEPDKHTATDAPTLRGHALPPDLLAALYWENAQRLFP